MFITCESTLSQIKFTVYMSAFERACTEFLICVLLYYYCIDRAVL